MGKIPDELREIIAWNIRDCRYKRFPGAGGSKQCAEAFKVPPQQWSHWETGKRTPDESSLARIAEFFGTTVEYMRRDNRFTSSPDTPETIETHPNNGWKHRARPGSAESFFWLLHDFIKHLMTDGIKIRIDGESKRSSREAGSGRYSQ